MVLRYYRTIIYMWKHFYTNIWITEDLMLSYQIFTKTYMNRFSFPGPDVWIINGYLNVLWLTDNNSGNNPDVKVLLIEIFVHYKFTYLFSCPFHIFSLIILFPWKTSEMNHYNRPTTYSCFYYFWNLLIL